ARAFVAALGGELRVASEQGVGSRFFFELALDRGEDLPESEMPLSRDPQTLPGARVLVAEDDAVNRLVIGAMLGKLGLEHHIVGDGAEAFEAIASDDWDVVLMDVQMPEIDGYEVTRRVRELPEGRRAVPIVALTANALEQDRADAEAAGMDGFLGKPVKLEQLHRVLSRMLRRKRAKAAVALPVEPRQARAHG
ncbi:MAG: response regulator, partial [Myxococcales bacterium]|nr:response regulator [Myxococcales bacterium]